MLKVAECSDWDRIVEILTCAFESNASVHYIVKQDDQRIIRIRRLMEYSMKICTAFGKVVLSDDKNAAALVLHKKRGFNLLSVIWDLQLIFGVTGLRNLRNVLKREALIEEQHPMRTIYYLWFIGVDPAHNGHGIGSELLTDLIADAEFLSLPMYLETSTVKNLPWYAKFGFQVFHKIDMSYKLFFLSN